MLWLIHGHMGLIVLVIWNQAERSKGRLVRPMMVVAMVM